MEQYSLKMPHTVYAGKGALENLKDILTMNATKVAVFADQGIISEGLLEKPLHYIEEAGIPYEIISDLTPEPTCDEAQNVVSEFNNKNCDFIVAVGGGSVMDTAKLSSILATDEYQVRDLLDDPKLAKKCVKSLMIPTTAGTGAEATPNAIVAVPEKQLKVGIVNDEMIPDYVLLDGEMIKNLPRKIAAATGIDAMAHAIECFTSNKANPFSDTFALKAFDLIINNIEAACDDKNADDARNSMLIAAFYAGVAITASGTTAVHALSYPLGGKYHIPHGVSNAIMLAPVMKFNEPVVRERFAMAYDRVNHEGNASLTVEEKSAWVLERMCGIIRHLDIPTNLKEYGVSKDDLDFLVEAGMDVQRLLVNNMRTVTADDARELYLQIL
ncbi:iron-containing alcohol dehydrogenase [Eubacterium sp. MSJ-13]|uniref:iron-containing alcohol dehydrogenase n=1 Tax=Eubacterium sp. MSJ-13 TaxID=2841513 RepID=UPI001C102C79|nr:iron-containing alcohol dehydrogenase [Eubacterium sp. MSJ-13]MBU5478652.1 iron-containing alcohol dehydrogenase [Eubacterium sp. MSJ-13]